MSQQRRCAPGIIAQILETTLEGERKTQVMYNVRVDFRTISKYLEYLMEKGLLERTGQRYKATVRGRLYLQRYREASRILEG